MNRRRRYKPHRPQRFSINLPDEKIQIEDIDQDYVRFLKIENGVIKDEFEIKRDTLIVLINGIGQYLVDTKDQQKG